MAGNLTPHPWEQPWLKDLFNETIAAIRVDAVKCLADFLDELDAHGWEVEEQRRALRVLVANQSAPTHGDKP